VTNLGCTDTPRKTLDPEDEDKNGVGHNPETDSACKFDNDHVLDAAIKDPWDQGNDHLLFFGSPRAPAQLSAFHPKQAQIFRLWQVYLENVNPMLKVTHASTLQARIVDAISNMANISPALEALMFSIYCVAIVSLTEDECLAMFGTPRKELLDGYHFVCQQAMLKCRALNSDDRDCLTAFFLYLVSNLSIWVINLIKMHI
jgi:hypothetical protein